MIAISPSTFWQNYHKAGTPPNQTWGIWFRCVSTLDHLFWAYHWWLKATWHSATLEMICIHNVFDQSHAKLTSEKFERMATEAAREEAHLKSDIEILKSQKEELEARFRELTKESAGLRLNVEELEDERQKMRKFMHEDSANRDTISFLRDKLSSCILAQSILLVCWIYSMTSPQTESNTPFCEFLRHYRKRSESCGLKHPQRRSKNPHT